MKKNVTYMIQTTLEGGYDIIECSKREKIVGHTENEEAAKEIIEFLIKYNQ